MSAHYEVRCMFCDVVLAQCRCWSPNKQVKPGLCAECRDYKGDPVDRRKETPRPLDGLCEKPAETSQAPAPQGANMPEADPSERPTAPDQLTAKVELPLTPARAAKLVEAFNRYADACSEVKRALDVQDAGEAYRVAREKKFVLHGQVIGVVEATLAYIGVHAP